MSQIISQELLKTIALNADSSSIENFIKNDPVGVVVVTAENQDTVSKLIKLDFSDKYPKATIENALSAGTMDSTSYDAKYLQEDGKIKVGIAIIIQKDKKGNLDIYPNPDINAKYITTPTPEAVTDSGNNTINNMLSYYLKVAPVKMIKLSEVKNLSAGAIKNDDMTIESPWGSQSVSEGNNDAYLVIDSDKNEVYMVNIDPVTNLPLNYVRQGQAKPGNVNVRNEKSLNDIYREQMAASPIINDKSKMVDTAKVDINTLKYTEANDNAKMNDVKITEEFINKPKPKQS